VASSLVDLELEFTKTNIKLIIMLSVSVFIVLARVNVIKESALNRHYVKRCAEKSTICTAGRSLRLPITKRTVYTWMADLDFR